MTKIEISLLGELSVSIDGQLVTGIPTDKSRALLAYLALESSHPHNRRALAGLLWPETSDRSARDNLRNTIYRLRKSLDDVAPGASQQFLTVGRQVVGFDSIRATVDVLEFQARVTAVATHSHESLEACDECLASLAVAANLYHGDLAHGLSLADAIQFEEWLLLRREYLNLLALRALADLAGILETRQRYAEAHAIAVRMLDLDPFREDSHRQIMRLLARQEMPERALVQFEGLRKLLREELGVEPDPRTSELVQHISAGAFAAQERPALVATTRPNAATSEWLDAPLVGPLYGRTAQIRRLGQWLVHDHCQLITILGMGGVGKSTLAAHSARAASGHFDVVIWRSLLNAPPLHELLTSVMRVLARDPLESVPESIDEAMALLLVRLRSQRCLLVLDNVETILQAEPAGHYMPGYEDYGQLLRTVGAYEHKSCLLLTSRERPLDVERQEQSFAQVETMLLTGLDVEDAALILAHHGMATSEAIAANLSRRYSGNPMALNLVARSVQDLYLGNVESFLHDETPIFADIRDLLDQQIGRLTSLEQEIMFWLAIAREPLTPAALKLSLVSAPGVGDLVDAMRSLQRRSLLEKTGEGFGLQDVVTEYLADRLVDQISREIERGPIGFLDRYALLHTQVSEAIRQSQRRLILDPIVHRVAARRGSPELAALLHSVVARLGTREAQLTGYAAGNILNLMLHAGVDVAGLDFSRQNLRQAHLQGVQLPKVRFAGVAFSSCTFTDTANVITSVAFSPDGQFIAAGSADNLVRLWRIADGMLATVLSGHAYVVTSVAFSPDGSLLASGSIDSTVRLWDVARPGTSGSGRQRAVLRGHDHSVLAVAFSPDGSTLASGSRDTTIRLWDVDEALAADRDSASEILRGHSALVLALDFSPDGRTLASAGADHTIRLWRFGKGSASAARPSDVLTGHTERVTSVAFNHDGQMLASASNDTTLRLWNPQSGQCLHEMRGHGNWITSIAFDPTGRTVASSSIDHAIFLWNIFDEQVLAGRRPPHVLRDHTDWVRSVAFSPDGRILVSGGDDKTVRLWDVRTRQLLRLYQGFKNRVLTVAFSPDGSRLASGSEDGVARQWRPGESEAEAELRGSGSLSPAGQISSVAFHPGGRLVAAASGRAPVRIWDADTGNLVFTLSGHDGRLNCVVFSPDGHLAAAGGEDHVVYLWPLRSLAVGKQPRILRVHEQAVKSLAFNPDSTVLASGSADHTVSLWDVSAGQVHNRLVGHGNWVNGVAFSPDGGLLASGSADGAIRLWDAGNGALVRELPGHNAWVRSVVFAPDGRTLASGGNDFMVRLWDIASGSACRVLSGHEDMVWSLAYSPDGRTLASGSGDETVKLWDPDTGECMRTWRMPGPYHGMDISGATGITEAQRAALLALGAVDGEREVDVTFRL